MVRDCTSMRRAQCRRMPHIHTEPSHMHTEPSYVHTVVRQLHAGTHKTLAERCRERLKQHAVTVTAQEAQP